MIQKQEHRRDGGVCRIGRLHFIRYAMYSKARHLLASECLALAVNYALYIPCYLLSYFGFSFESVDLEHAAELSPTCSRGMPYLSSVKDFFSFEVTCKITFILKTSVVLSRSSPVKVSATRAAEGHQSRMKYVFYACRYGL